MVELYSFNELERLETKRETFHPYYYAWMGIFHTTFFIYSTEQIVLV